VGSLRRREGEEERRARAEDRESWAGRGPRGEKEEEERGVGMGRWGKEGRPKREEGEVGLQQKKRMGCRAVSSFSPSFSFLF
jgi:hypothetical protein